MSAPNEPFENLVPPPDNAGPARLVVCETTGHWAAGLRRQLTGSAARLSESRSLSDCWDTLARAPASFLVLELTAANLLALLERLGRLPRQYPFARAAVVTARDLAEYQWIVREAGAVHFAYEPRRLWPLVQIISCHLATSSSPFRTPRQQLWAGLPWANYGPKAVDDSGRA